MVWNGKRTKRRNRGMKRKVRKVIKHQPQPLQKGIKNALSYRTPVFRISPYITKMFYYDYVKQLTPVLGVPDVDFYSANSLYDPDTTGVGHQPIGFDQIMLMYEQFTVTHARIKVTFQNANDHNTRVAIYLSPDAIGITDPIKLMENGTLVTDVLQGNNGATQATQSLKTLEYNIDVKKYFGRRNNREMLNDPELHGNVAANPLEQVYFGVTAWDPYGANNETIAYDVILEYSAIFTEPKKLNPS